MMTIRDWLQLALLLLVLLFTTKPLGIYLAKIFDGSKTLLTPLLGPIEKRIYRFLHVNPTEEQTWSAYSVDLLVFSAVTVALAYVILRTQHHLPLNPQGQSP